MTTATRDIMVEGQAVTIPGPYRDMAAFRQKNKAMGFYFFSPDTMRFFDSRIESGMIAGRFFITSEQPPRFSDGTRSPRGCTVRIACDDGRIRTVGKHLGHDTFDAALHVITSILEG